MINMNYEIEFKASKFRKVIAFIMGVLFILFAVSGLSAEMAGDISQKFCLNPVFTRITLRSITVLLGLLTLYGSFIPYSVYISPQYIRTTFVKPVLWHEIDRIEKMTKANAIIDLQTAPTNIHRLRILTFYLKPGCKTEINGLGLFSKKTDKFAIVGQNLQEPDKLEEEIKKYFPDGIS